MSTVAEGRIIPLTKGFFAIVDEEDFERVNQFRWHWNDGYARRTIRTPSGKRTCQILHRFIMGDPPEMEVDHKSMNKLDCRKDNLRICTKAQNHCNRALQSNNRSGFKGVSQSKGRWQAIIYCKKKSHHLGFFDDKHEAAAAYAKAAKELHGEFARIENPVLPSHTTTERLERPLHTTNSSGFHGVTWCKSDNRWKAQIQVEGKNLFIGNFQLKEEAFLARKRAEGVVRVMDTKTLTGGLLRAACAQSVDS